MPAERGGSRSAVEKGVGIADVTVFAKRRQTGGTLVRRGAGNPAFSVAGDRNRDDFLLQLIGFCIWQWKDSCRYGNRYVTSHKETLESNNRSRVFCCLLGDFAARNHAKGVERAGKNNARSKTTPRAWSSDYNITHDQKPRPPPPWLKPPPLVWVELPPPPPVFLGITRAVTTLRRNVSLEAFMRTPVI